MATLKQSRVRCAVVFAGLGLILPVVIVVMDRVLAAGWWPTWIDFVWPTSVILIAVGGDPFFTTASIAYHILAILLNMVLYGYMGSLVPVLIRRIAR